MLRKNIVHFLIAITLSFILIAAKFAHIQIYKAEELQREVVDQRVKKVEEIGERGMIKDSKGNVLSMTMNVKDIAVYPNMIKSNQTRKKIASLLSKKLNIEEDEILEKLNEKNSKGDSIQWARIKKKVDPTTAYELKRSDLSGYIEITDSPNRDYLNGKLASNILGFVNDEGEPGAGLELSLNKYLSGISGFRIAEFDHMGNPIPIGMETISKPVSGDEVKLTIDSYIQYILEKTLEESMKEMNAKQAHAIVMNPNNGEILGMASYPNFDPNDYQSYDKSTYNNHPASYVYEPGSTFKPMYMAIALDAGTIDENTTFYDGAGSINVQGFNLKNWDSVGLGTITLQDIIVQSSNVGMVHISQTMSEEQIINGLENAGFSEKTGVELPNEESGLFPDLETLKVDPLVKATESYGHGIAVTPLQVAKSFSEIINGGYKIQPTLVKTVTDGNGNLLYESETKKGKRIWSEKTVGLLKDYLGNTWVDSSGEPRIEGYDGGGKTGTTSKLENGVYTDKIVGSFVGYVPQENPKYVMLAVVDEPEGYEYRFGNTTGGPIFSKAMSEILRYENIEKTDMSEENEEDGLNENKKEKKQLQFEFKDYKLWFLEDAIRDLEERFEKEIVVTNEGDGEIVIGQRYKYKNNKVHIYLETSEITGEGKTYIPKVIGMSFEEIKDLFRNQGIKIEFIGEGNAFSQSINPGEYDKRIKTIKFWLD